MMENPYILFAKEDFTRARKRETITRILSLLKAQKDEMLSLGDVRTLLKPESESYQGMRTVPIEKIVGSEGRYMDFNKAFLPRHDKMMRRWIHVDLAHYQNVILPPIQLFEVGGVYFVRDGNHRVSVAKARGAHFIDAEVTSLTTEVSMRPEMTREELKRAVIDFEKKRFFEATRLDQARPGCSLEFTEVGRYDELLAHILEHKWYINLKRKDEIPLGEAAVSWHDRVYFPIIQIVRESRLTSRFPGTTESDLYVYVGQHWGELRKRYGPLFTLEEAAEDFSVQSERPRMARTARLIARRVAGLFGIRVR